MIKNRIRYAAWNPYTIIETTENGTKLQGLVADVYETMEKLINFKYEAVVQPDLMFGKKDASGKWSGMIGAMIANEADISGPYFMNEERIKVMRFGNPLSFSQLSIMSGLVPANKSPFLIFTIFSMKVWILIILSLLIITLTALSVYFIKPNSTILKRTKSEVFWKYMWLFYGGLLGQDFGNKKMWFLRHVWSSGSFRIIEGFWFLQIGVVLVHTYQGTITSTFASDKLHPKINTLEDIMRDSKISVITFENSYPESCLSSKYNKIYASVWRRMSGKSVPNMKNLKEIPDWMELIGKGKMVFISEIMFLKSLVGERFKQTGKCEIRVTPINFCSAYISLGFNKNYNNTQKETFEENLLRYVEGGLTQRSFMKSTLHYDKCTQAKMQATKPLTLLDVTGSFMILGIGIIISFIVFLVEKMCSK